MREDIFRERLALPELQLIDERELEEDREYMMQMYPARARLIMVMVEDECDKLEYEGSPMFAPYPDKETVLTLAGNIFDKVSFDRGDQNLRHLIDVLMCNEFCVRRNRFKRRRKFF